MKVLLALVLNLLITEDSPSYKDSVEILLSNVRIQIEATQAINDMYNFKFDDAEMQFRWILQKYPEHPLPHYLLGLSEWWKIMPNVDNPAWDESFHRYMDISIEKAEAMSETPGGEVESSFFLAAAYGLKGRLYSERGRWGKAANAGRLALKYQKAHKDMHYLSPEFLFGDALYNYYSVWIRENYPLLKPIMIPFPKGDKNLGIQQLRTVATNAFYTRTEAQLFLMRILALDERDLKGAIQVAEYLHETFPNNPYFHRFYARLLYSTGRHKELEGTCLDILIRIDQHQTGYEANSGRYASFFLGEYYDAKGMDDEAKLYFERAVEFGNEIEAFETGYYLFSLLRLSQMAEMEEDFDTAEAYLRTIKKYARRKDRVHKQARANLKRVNQKRKSK